MPIIKVAKIPKKQEKPEDFIALFCLYYQQYTFAQARKMPYKRLRQMLKVAQKDEARQYRTLLQIVIAPHGKKGTAQKLAEAFNAIIDE